VRQSLSEDRGVNEVPIREFYHDFVPPRYVLRLVRSLLSSGPAKYFPGLDSVVLTNQSGAPRRDRLGKATTRQRRLAQNSVLGRYHGVRSGRPAWIELYVDNLGTAISCHPFVPMGRTACFAMVLFHEIGHHVHATVRPEFREKEDIADDWAKKLTKNYFLSRNRRVPWPIWKIVGWALKAIAAEL
jgi:hypothetical protein